MRDINSEKQNSKKQHVILRKEYQPELFKVSRGLLVWLSVALMTVVFMLGYLAYPKNNLLKGYAAEQAHVAVYNVPMNPVLSAEVDALKGQLIGLISGSIESKLRVLEINVSSGKVTETDLAMIQDLKNDVEVLKTYSATGAGRLIAAPYLEKKANPHEMSNQLLNEVSQLKQLIYLSMAACGLMFAAVGGIWVRQSLRLEADTKSKILPNKTADKK